jgi:hypothetical protein
MTKINKIKDENDDNNQLKKEKKTEKKEKTIKKKVLAEKDGELVVLKKRGRKPKSALTTTTTTTTPTTKLLTENEINITYTITETDDIKEDLEKPVAKKRGRKPKGGKIIQQVVLSNSTEETKPNVILHLKCCLNDLKTDTFTSSTVESYNFDTGDLTYEIIMNENNSSDKLQLAENANNMNNIINNDKYYNEEDYEEDDSIKDKETTDSKEIWKKLKHLEHNLHINNISDKKSACFWCTYEFDNPQIYIPKHFVKNSYHVYGCFCSPECATAFLMEENIDSSTKFERYHLLNNIYSRIYNFKKNIKPAANPYYMLEKYYGNLTIQEYRALLRNERLFLIVDKPLTRILPELHEDNDDFIINNKIIPSNSYQVKKKLHKKPPNVSIFNDKFGSSFSSTQ